MEHLDKHDNISSVSGQDHDAGSRQEAIEQASEQLLAAESEYVRAWRKKNGRQSQGEKLSDITGLALSGGGIRSATFALGVLQALAHHDLLKKFDYLSTVSGGGYIGSAITWLLSSKANAGREDGTAPFSADKAGFPFGSDTPDPHAKSDDTTQQKAMLEYLRDHGHYLNPGEGISLFALLGVVLRGTLLNLIVWLPLAIVILIAGFWLPQHLSFLEIFAESPWLEEILSDVNDQYQWSSAFLGYELLLRLGFCIVVFFVLGIIAYSLLTWLRRSDKCGSAAGYCWYVLRRDAEKFVSILLPTTLLLLIVGMLPVATAYMASVGPMTLLIGVGLHIREFMKRISVVDKKPLEIVAPIAAALFLYGFIAVAFQLAYVIWGSAFTGTAVIVLSVVSFGVGYFSNLNYIAVHRYYRDRLMENYMPDIKTALANGSGIAKEADQAHFCCFNDPGDATSPYHLVNANVVLADSKQSVYHARGGDNFILSPIYCGSNATGWCPTHQYMQGRMTLATAFAISGAAINPNAGVGGEGVTTNKMVSLAMSLLNLRLGYWAHNPEKAPFNDIANHFNPGGYYALGSLLNLMGFNEKNPFVELSDGGHFENMAMYELVRRRAKLILVSDGGEDSEFSFSDFQTTIRRIETDFGARIDFHESHYGPNEIMPQSPTDAEYPQDVAFSERGYMVGTIHYADESEGRLVYLKTVMVKEASFKVKGYKAQYQDFPDQSTADQFFDDVQFEAYRELGFVIADSMIKDSNVNLAGYF